MYRNDGEQIVQTDHLIARGNSATFVDCRLMLCVCKGYHGWKSLSSNLHKKQNDEIIRNLILKERIALWDACE